MYIPINLIFITKTFDQFQKNINFKLLSIKIETKFLKENKKSHFIKYFSKHIKYIKLYH